MPDTEGDLDLAEAWLSNERLYRGRGPDDHSVPDGYDFGVDARVYQLAETNPAQTSELVMRMIDVAQDEEDLGEIGRGPLETVLRYHGESLAQWVSDRAETSPRFRFALAACWPFDPVKTTVDRLNLHRGNTHSYWTMAIRVRCTGSAPLSAFLDARLQRDVVGGDMQLGAGKCRPVHRLLGEGS